VNGGFQTMSWSKKTAQGFSPGCRDSRTRPERAAETVPILQINLLSYSDGVSVVLSSICSGAATNFVGQPYETPKSVALSGRSRTGAFPGLKPWLFCETISWSQPQTANW
jgi:hypothetical protein